jgi:hypothetical protein
MSGARTWCEEEVAWVQEIEGEGMLPLDGTIPDMTATTELYLQLQRVYRARADVHIEAVHAHCKSLLKSVGKAEDAIPLDYIKLLCRNARHVRVVRPAAAVRPPSEMNSECLRKVRCLQPMSAAACGTGS